MGLFPSIWELWLPNWNYATTIGIFLMVIGVLALVFLTRIPFAGDYIAKGAWIAILVGFFLTFILSMIQDFVLSTGGAVITSGIFIIVVFWLILFWKPKKKSYD